jgi:hypothetical protein
MVSTNPAPQAAEDRWHRFSAASVRAFHRYGTWLVGLTWWRFTLYALLLIIATQIVKHIPPFSMSYTETVIDSGSSSRHRSSHRTPTPPQMPVPPMPAEPPALPAPGIPAPPSPPTAPSSPAIRITKTPGGANESSKSVDINIPGIVIDTKKRGTVHEGDVDITFDEKGIHIHRGADGKSAEAEAEAAAASAAAASAVESAKAQADAARQQVAEARVQAHEAARQAAESASRAAAAAAAAAVTHSASGVDISAGGQTVHVNVPPNATSDDVRDAIQEAQDSIVEAIRDAEQQRRDDAREAAAEADAARKEAQAEADVPADDDHHDLVRTHTVRFGDMLGPMALWWILGSLLLKITYKGRIQAEEKAAVATETAEAESLRRQVLEARMAMMQAQVEPHFLFNTLASIDHLIEFDPKRASQMQRNLISLLRASMPSMRASDSGLRPLDLELAVVRPYLEILKVRMEERLTTEIDVPDGLLSAEFPPMMIQTLVENSIKHGLEPKAEGGHLAVKAEIRHGNLCVTVTDTGLGFENAKGETHGTGVGLSNIRERLALLYGPKAMLTIANNPVGGTIVTITVPYTTHTDEGEST